MSLLLWLVLAVCLAVCLAYAGLLLHQLANDGRLDVIVARTRLLRAPFARGRMARLLVRRIVWDVVAAGVLDLNRRILWLPDSVEALVAPADLRTLGPAVAKVRRRILQRLDALATAGPCRFHARPVVSLVDDPSCRSGRPTLRLAFGESTDQLVSPGDAAGAASWTQDAATPQRAYLRLVRPAGTPMRLRAGQLFRIGRLPSCELVIEQPSVSRCHAVVYERDGGWYVRDEGSTNGTFVNLAPVTGPARLRNADEIRIGATATLRFELLPPQAPRWHRRALHDS
jgi:hypothetical protein